MNLSPLNPFFRRVEILKAFALLGVFILFLLAAVPLAWTEGDPTRYPFRDPSPEMLNSGSIVIRKSCALLVLLQSPVSTEYNRVGDPVDAVLMKDLFIGNVKVLTRDARLKGFVSRVEQPLEGRNAILGLDFNELRLPNGQLVALKAHARADNADHSWGGGLTQGTQERLVTHRVAGIGEYNKLVLGGPWQMGSPVSFPPGKDIMVILDEAIVVPLLED